MTEPSPNRRRLLIASTALLALLAVAVPLVVFLVSTRSSASFADTEVLDANRLGAASVELEIVPGPSPDPSARGDVAGAVLSARNLAPGDSVTGHLELANVGTVPVRYGLVAFGSGGPLAEWLRFEVWPGTGSCGVDPLVDGAAPRLVEDVRIGFEPVTLVPLGSLGDPAGPNVLEPGEGTVVCVGASLALETPNEAQGQSLDLTLRIPVEQVVEGP